MSDSWHKHIICPKCYSDIRQRLFFAALQNIDRWSIDTIISDKRVLQFAPEEIVSLKCGERASAYTTADYSRQDCDLQHIDMSYMPKINSESFDVLIAFDVLEHVPDYKNALEEVYRVLSSRGVAIFTVPQKDNLAATYEDPTIVTPEDRTRHFGQFDHLRIFGDDFSDIVESKGFTVTTVNELMFTETIQKLHVLFPPELSTDPLATNYRKVFFCQKKL